MVQSEKIYLINKSNYELIKNARYLIKTYIQKKDEEKYIFKDDIELTSMKIYYEYGKHSGWDNRLGTQMEFDYEGYRYFCLFNPDTSMLLFKEIKIETLYGNSKGSNKKH